MDLLQRSAAGFFLILAIATPLFSPALFLSPLFMSLVLGFAAVLAFSLKRKEVVPEDGLAPKAGRERALDSELDGCKPENTGSGKPGPIQGEQLAVERDTESVDVRIPSSRVQGTFPEGEQISQINGNFVSSKEMPGVAEVNPGSRGSGQSLLDGKPAIQSSTPGSAIANGAKDQKLSSLLVPLSEAAEEKSKVPDLSKLKDSVSASPGARAMAAALRARMSKSAPEGQSDLLVFYGSQTGNAMEIAKGIAAEAPARGIKSRVFALNDFPLDKLARSTSIQLVLVVVSSTGDGDPPENCDRFYHGLRKASEPNYLKNVRFTVCGLGDSNYTKFMGVPKLFNSRFLELGAQRFYNSCQADEVEGLEDVVDKWTAGLWGPLKVAIQSASLPGIGAPKGAEITTADPEPEVKLVGIPPLQPCRIQLVWERVETADSAGTHDGLVRQVEGQGYTSAYPFLATVSSAHYMTAKWSDRKVVHATLDIRGSGITYHPGDSIGVMPLNDEGLVGKLLNRLGIDGTKVFSLRGVQDGSGAVCTHIKFPCSVKTALLRHCALTGLPTKGFLRMLAEYTSNAAEKEILLQLCSRSGKDLYAKEILAGRPNVLDLLNEFASCNPPLAHLLDSLPPLVSRYYSVSSAPVESPNSIDIAFSVVEFETKKDRLFKGVCTSWLEMVLDLEGGVGSAVQIPIFPKSGGAFHLPPDLSCPIIMIGPGTGVAPFRGFLQERRKLKEGLPESAVGGSWLFFGCRRADEDYLYQNDFEDFERDGTLTHFEVAFSRGSDTKVYVQDKMKQHGEALCSLLVNNRTYVYICGDGANMAKDVHLTLLQMLQQHGGLKESMSIAHFNEMTKQGRYVRDIWS